MSQPVGDEPQAPRLPRLWRGRRRSLLAQLAGVGVAQAVLAAVTALLTPRLLTVPERSAQLALTGILVVLALAVGGLRVAERWLGERLGQDYVHDVRVHLVRAALAGNGPSVGVTVARTTNDLTSVRNWMVLGVVPLLVGIPTVVGTVVALALLSPVLAVALAVPIGVLGGVLVALAPAVQRRAARLRKQRGRMAGAITDAVTARESVMVAGGVERETKRLGRTSREVGELAVQRALLSGWLRGTAASVATLSMVVVAGAGVLAGVDAATIASAFVIVGMVATPVTDLGRVSEYRQSFRVAERILAPQVALSRAHRREERELAGTPRRPSSGGRVHLSGLRLAGEPVPDLVAEPGEIVVVHSTRAGVLDELVASLVHPGRARDAWLAVDGQDLARLAATDRRELLAVASGTEPVERGTVARAVRYRLPDSDQDVWPVLRQVGLAEAVQDLPKQERTQLRRGGEPLDLQQRVRLQLARAWYGAPALVVLDRIDQLLDLPGRQLLAAGAQLHGGVTLVLSERPDQLPGDLRRWDLDADPARPSLPTLPENRRDTEENRD